ncbi:MAG: peptidase dimerization domain-containing protein, partial [Pygmaiobacter sp.]
TVKIHKHEAMAATDLFSVTIEGKGGHGGAPQQAVDVIPPLAELLAALNTIIPREISPFSPAVLTVGTVNTISSVWNATPGKVELSGTFRTYDDKVREHIAQRIGDVAASIAAAHRCKAMKW